MQSQSTVSRPRIIVGHDNPAYPRCLCGHRQNTHDGKAGCIYGSRKSGICGCLRFRQGES